MPQKNSVKIYYANAFYHVYNRGVEKREIFLDRNDYLAFLHLLKTALSLETENGDNTPSVQGATLHGKFGDRRVNFHPRKNFFGKIDLMSYCLIPNHYHFLLRQLESTGVTQFMRSVLTSYTMYFNKKYDRVGSLFQGIFKATNIQDENYLLWVSRYIHRNPPNFQDYPYSSYGDYIGQRKSPWINTNLVLGCFSSQQRKQAKNYREFVETEKENPIEISDLFLEED